MRGSFDQVRQAAAEAQDLLNSSLACWFPRCIAAEGGFHQAFARDWTRLPEATRFQVHQFRMVWVAATAAEARPGRREEFESFVRHGLAGIQQQLSDQEYGGTLWRADVAGHPVGDGASFKRSYGIAFEIFALATVARVFADESARKQAMHAFEWLERLYDEKFGGWYEAARRDGTPIRGDKVFNSHLHIFEALLELRRIEPDPLIERRIDELARIFTTQMATEEGRMNPHFRRNWAAKGAKWEIGHDLEAAYLLLMAGFGKAIQTKALKTVEFALSHGFDHDLGGFFEAGNAKGEIVDGDKGFWTQDEGLNALVFAWKTSLAPKYQAALLKHWAWIRDRQYDPVHGGTFVRLTREGGVLGDGHKADPWKACYHDVRALVNLGNCVPVATRELDVP